MSKPQAILIYCTCPDQDSAMLLADGLVSNKYAACVNIIPNITSVYTWQGAVESSQEFLLIIKSSVQHNHAIQELITAKHPYDCPEIIAVDIVNGFPPYMDWLHEVIK